MNAEFKQYVQAICPETEAAEVAMSGRNLLQKALDWIESFGPYVGELRPWQGMRAAVRHCCKRREAIGFHGLA